MVFLSTDKKWEQGAGVKALLHNGRESGCCGDRRTHAEQMNCVYTRHEEQVISKHGQGQKIPGE